jgi:hypothetical protein
MAHAGHIDTVDIWERDPLEGADPSEGVGSRHHIVPKFYLDRFADSRGYLTIVDRDTGRESVQHVRKVLREKDYFTVVNLDMEPDGRVEQLLATIEGNAATALVNVTRTTLRCWPPPPKESVKEGTSGWGVAGVLPRDQPRGTPDRGTSSDDLCSCRLRVQPSIDGRKSP